MMDQTVYVGIASAQHHREVIVHDTLDGCLEELRAEFGADPDTLRYEREMTVRTATHTWQISISETELQTEDDQ